MAPTSSPPYPEGSFYAVHTGFKAGVYHTFREFKAQTAGYPGAIFAVFSDLDHANEFKQTGNPPAGVEPLIADTPGSQRLTDEQTHAIHSGAASSALATASCPHIPAPLPTPSVSPDRSYAAAPVTTLTQPTRSQVPNRPYSSQPTPSTPRKPIKPEADSDEGGDTEPEDEIPAPLRGPVTPVSGARTAAAPVRQTRSAITPGASTQRTTPGRQVKAGSISSALRRDLSSSGLPPHIIPEPLSTGAPFAGSPSKPTIKSETETSTLPRTTPKTTPAHAKDRRMRDCTHCNGTGRVACSDSENDAPEPSGSKRRAASPTLERRPKRLSDGQRAEVKTKALADKGKGKARVVEKPDSEPRTPSTSTRDRYV